MKRPIAELEREELGALCGFVAEAWRRFPDAPPPEKPVTPPDATALAEDPAQALRRYRQLASIHLLWNDLTGQADIEATGKTISELARSCLELSLEAAEARIAEAHGRLHDADGKPIRLAILGLGKLGGNELNFNSDIDIVYCFEGSGQSDGRRRLDAPGWLNRVAREQIALLDNITGHGRVWIVDTRLRPFGDAGALVWSVPAMEQYFLNEGRTWERYAWLKAGPAAGDADSAQQLLDALGPFVFRRYLDYGIFDSLRELHAKIDANSRARSRRDDIKRGAGGIRELEFLVQSQQILRGGHEHGLRARGFFPALAACRQAGLIDDDSGAELHEAYGFLRILENRLQAMSGRQGHHLPDDEQGQAALARLMGAENWSVLVDEIAHHRERVRGHFAERFRDPPAKPLDTPALWPPGADLESNLVEAGFDQPEAVASRLQSVHKRLANRALSAEGHRRLERLMPLLLDEAGRHDPPDTGLDQLLELIDQISRRSAYLALLYERPETLSRLVRVFRASARLADWIVAAPQLLDDLLDPVHGFDLPGLPELNPGDTEASLHALGRWRQTAFLRTALAELDDRLDAVAAGQQLSNIAATIIEQVLSIISEDEPDLAVIGYGNLGAGLMHYESDLDVVFLHGDGPAPVRTAQRLISFMQMPLPGGRLFEIDTRLRPNGRAGLLVSSVESFADYQNNKAWTWEHQALIRARWIAGNPGLAEPFETVRRDVLGQSRAAATVREELSSMRARQQRQRREEAAKRRLTDLQYIAELGILGHAAEHPELIDTRSPPEQFARLREIGWLEAGEADGLIKAWQTLSGLRHRAWLARSPAGELPVETEQVIDAAWQRVFGQDES